MRFSFAIAAVGLVEGSGFARFRLSTLAAIFLGLLSLGHARGAEYAELIRATPGLLVFDPGERSAGDGSATVVIPACQDVGDVLRNVSSRSPALGKAARLTATSYLRTPSLGAHEAVTIELWLNVAQLPTEPIGAVFAVDGWNAGFVHWNLKSNGAIELAVNGAGGIPNSDAGAISTGRWMHLVASYDSRDGSLRIYRDGRPIVEATVDPHPRVELAEAAIGSWIAGGPSRPLQADVDEVAIYNTALSADQIRAHYLAGRGEVGPPVDFARDVQPIFAKHCVSCHGPDTQESLLRLDVRDWVLRGGESGEPAVLPFDAESSQLLARVRSADEETVMPPAEPRLTSAEIAILQRWIDQGAQWPDDLAGQAPAAVATTTHWSFQPLQNPLPPPAEHPFVRTGNSIDAFIFARLAASDLQPAAEADRRTLVRRLYLDVHGLPPSPDEIRQFVDDQSPDAWSKLVDRVLASPRYAERWASHWLDVIRYADTHGYEVNTPRDNAWPYRDYVIKSLAADKPYDRFLQEQIAGDQLGVDAATGFLVAAPAVLPGQVGRDEPSMRLARVDELHEVVVTVSSGVLGLTVGCARCHNHKFDPIAQRDYYQLQAVFAGLHYGDRPVRDPLEVQLPSATAPPAKSVFGGSFSTPGATHRLYRGDPMQRRERVVPDIPAVFGSLELESTAPEAERRLALARWLTSATNPLTPRVIVNRIWQHHFGTGLVATPSDFGAMGVPPSHPELLDWLARNLVDGNWSLKAIHRLILNSNTYRQGAQAHDEGLAKDAASLLLWRFPARRLEMEPIRDSILATSGALDLTMGGPGFSVFQPNDNYVRVYNPKDEWGPGEWRRMVYVHRVRMAQDGVFGALDCPDAGQPAPRRSRSTTAIQALNLFNSSFVKQQADLLAARASQSTAATSAARITQAFELSLGRGPTAAELAAAEVLNAEHGLPAVCRALFNSNEFLFLP